MIPVQSQPWEPDLWPALLKGAVRSSAELLERVQSGPGITQIPHLTHTSFPVRVPEPYWRRIRAGDPSDPILRQVLAQPDELLDRLGFSSDPLAEAQAERAPGLLQKYKARALLMISPACAVHCRYCFRRHFPYEEHSPAHYQSALDAIKADSSLTEIILSGGDPLTVTDTQLAKVVQQLGEIPHLRRLRIHSRIPLVLPQRVTRSLLNLLRSARLPIALVLHVNHANELDQDTHRAFSCLRQAGITLLNQSVLLAGVNDNATSLTMLSERLYAQGVLPYYLHLPDSVRNTEHFYVNEARGRQIYREICDLLPGYLVPRLVQEVPGHNSKRSLLPADTAAGDFALPYNSPKILSTSD